MATNDELFQAFDLLLGAGLSYAPTAEMIEKTAKSWQALLSDISGDLIIQAAKDIAIKGERFPSVSEMRKAAAAVKRNNGKSAVDDHFKPMVVQAEQTVIWTGSPNWPPEEMRAEYEYMKSHPLQYWAKIEAETYGLDKNAVYAEWKKIGIKTFGDIEKWRERQQAYYQSFQTAIAACGSIDSWESAARACESIDIAPFLESKLSV